MAKAPADTATRRTYRSDAAREANMEAFAEIIRIAEAASQVGEDVRAGVEETARFRSCRVKLLPHRHWQRAAGVAARINPANAPLREAPLDGVLAVEPQRLTLLVQKYWGPRERQFTVSFVEKTPAELRARIISHMNAWSKTANKGFVETCEAGEIRVSFEPGGYWSYLGTDIRLVPEFLPTMNLEGFSMRTPESEYRRVVRHETGHTLGFPHEHMRKELVARIDPKKAYTYFSETQGWPEQVVDEQVLTPLDAMSILGTKPDEDSIMCYQLPGDITYDGKPIRGGTDINATDYEFAANIYPKSLLAPPGTGRYVEDDWDPALDVQVPY